MTIPLTQIRRSLSFDTVKSHSPLDACVPIFFMNSGENVDNVVLLLLLLSFYLLKERDPFSEKIQTLSSVSTWRLWAGFYLSLSNEMYVTVKSLMAYRQARDKSDKKDLVERSVHVY